MTNWLTELEWRGLLQDVSDRAALAKLESACSFYVGFDPTAPFLQLGNLIPLVASIHIARAGLKPIILFGGATGSIGDPSGRSSERPLLPFETITANVASQSAKSREIFKRCELEVQFVNNIDWTKDVTLLDFLRDIGKHFTVNYMLAKDTVKNRLSGDGISYTEFSYMLLQAFDYMTLYERYNCRMQIGGSDQWGNITAGLELLRRKGLAGAQALSIPLITDSAGKKFGKSESGAIWLDRSGTSPYQLHQFLLNVPDDDAMRYLKLLSLDSRKQIEGVIAEHQANPHKRAAQHALADGVCTLVHGLDATSEAKRSAEVLFGGSIDGVSDAELLEIFREVPSSEINTAALSATSVVDALVNTKLSSSKGEARKLIQGGGAYCNSIRLEDANTVLNSLLGQRRLFVLRAGKKNYHLLRVTP